MKMEIRTMYSQKGCDVEGDMPVGHLPLEVFRNFKKLGQICII